jgi:hypothetical protein
MNSREKPTYKFKEEDVSRLAEDSLETLAEKDPIMFFDLQGIEIDASDWAFERVTVCLRDGYQNRNVVFEVDYDLENFRQSYSLADLAREIENACSTDQFIFDYWQDDEIGVLSGFGVSIGLPLHKRFQDVLDLGDKLYEFDRYIRDKLAARPRHAVTVDFNFPLAVRSSCEQYLAYFCQFLSDLGIEAMAEMKEGAHSVLFSVFPSDGEQALKAVSEALQIYLGLPTASNLTVESVNYEDVAVKQLNANVLHLQSQIMLAQAAIALKNATIEAKDERIALLEDRIDLRKFQPAPTSNQTTVDKEDLVGGLVSLKKWDYKFLELNLPEIFRRLKRRLK